MSNTELKESVKVLNECIELQLNKSRDYQNPNSRVVQAMYYTRGIDTIHDILHAKMLRAQSLLEAAHVGQEPNFESIEDTYKDIINYASFAVSWMRGKIHGQNLDADMFNREIVEESTSTFSVGTTSSKNYNINTEKGN